MTTSIVLRKQPTAAAVRSGGAGRRALILVFAAVSIAMGLILARTADWAAEPVTAAAAPASPLSQWLDRLELIQLENQLVRAGYSVRADGSLDPVTKSAFADYLQLDASHPLSRFLATELQGTVLTGFRDPAAWNKRFGLNRQTRFVERPLTGPNGQLDANGNLR
jgi:hypothetical protein